MSVPFRLQHSLKKLRPALAGEITTFLTANQYGTVKVPLEVFNKLVPMGGLSEEQVQVPGKRTQTTVSTQDGKFRTCGFLRDYKAKS